jgi:NAD(P)-dependent dehydrogenase (short-subunit alcohol dehydrogenase family)
MFSLSGKVALVTGAGSGIGAAIAETLASAGARVFATDRDAATAAATVERIRRANGRAEPAPLDVVDEEACRAIAQMIVRESGALDILVNNAGTNPHFGPLLTAEESHWQKTLDVNLLGYFRMVKACVGSMRSRGGGKIINMASVAGLQPQMGMGVYGVTKAGVLMLTRVLAAELAADNIQVNAIAPGFVRTKFTRVLWETPHLYDAILKIIPQGRMAEAGELAGIALYLASSASDFTTGSVFVIDGGQLVSQRIEL